MIKLFDRLVLTVALVAFQCIGLCAQEKFSVFGTVHGRENGVLAFVHSLARGDYIEIPFTKGQFLFEGVDSSFRFYNLALLEDVQRGQINIVPIAVEPGKTVVDVFCQPMRDGNTPLQLSFISAGEINTRLMEYSASLWNSRQKEFDHEAWLKQLNELFDDNMDNALGLFIAYTHQAQLPREKIKSFLATLPSSYSSSMYYKIVRSKYIGAATGKIGQTIMDFELPDRRGNFLRLSDVAGRNRYTLVELWGSWCGPCIESARGIKPIYKKYKSNRFEVYGIALETKWERWAKVLDVEGYEWINVVELEKKLTTPHSISYLLNPASKKPFNIVIDSKMKVIARDVSAEELDKLLSKTLAKND